MHRNYVNYRFVFLGVFFILALCALPLSRAASVTGWYYTGDTFKLGSTVYSVEGNDYNKVLLGVGTSLFFINLGECKIQNDVSYCYLQSAYPSDAAHIKYDAGHQYYGYYIETKDVGPSITVTQSAAKSTLLLGESSVVDITMENTGDYPVNDLLYEQTIPSGLVLDTRQSKASFSLKSLSIGQRLVFHYTVIPTDYGTTTLIPNMSYTYNNKIYSIPVTALSFNVDVPFTATKSVTTALNIGDTGKYQFNITNTNKQYPLVGTIHIIVPAQLFTSVPANLKAVDDGYTADILLDPNDQTSFSFSFGSSSGGSYTIKTNLTTKAGEVIPSSKYYEDVVNTNADKLQPLLKINPAKAVYKSGETVTLYAILQNTNQKTTFESISGVVNGSGLFDNMKFSHERFSPVKNITESEITFVIPEVNTTTTKTITLSGKYLTPSGDWYTYSMTKDLKMNPFLNYVAVTKTLMPTTPVAGDNITITVHVKNIYNEYITINAYESYDPLFTKLSGISYDEASLARDAEKDVYIYQLAIPKNASGVYNLTTSILVKGEEYPMKFTTPIIIGAAPIAQNAQGSNTTALAGTTGSSGTPGLQGGASASGTRGANETVKEEGFFTKLWNDIKRWFSGS